MSENHPYTIAWQRKFAPQWVLQTNLCILSGWKVKYQPLSFRMYKEIVILSNNMHSVGPTLADAWSDFFYKLTANNKINSKQVAFSLVLVYFQYCNYTWNHNFSRYLHWWNTKILHIHKRYLLCRFKRWKYTVWFDSYSLCMVCARTSKTHRQILYRFLKLTWTDNIISKLTQARCIVCHGWFHFYGLSWVVMI